MRCMGTPPEGAEDVVRASAAMASNLAQLVGEGSGVVSSQQCSGQNRGSEVGQGLYQPRNGARASTWNKTAHNAIPTARPFPSSGGPNGIPADRKIVNGTAEIRR